MRKSIVLAFISSFIVFIVVNFLALIIGYSMAELIDFEVDRFGDYPAFIPFRMIYSGGFFPWELIELYVDMSDAGLKVFYMGLFIAPIIASIVAGLTGGDILKAVGGWVLTCITIMIMFAIIFNVEDAIRGYYCSSCTTESAIIEAIVHVLVNLMIFGALAGVIALLIGRSSD